MLDKWVSHLRALLAEVSSDLTATAASVTGQGVFVATESDIQTDLENGLKQPQEHRSEAMKDVLIAKTRRDLDAAIQNYVKAAYDAGVLVDWVIMAETVNADLDKMEDAHELYMGMSDGLSSWKLWGIAHAMTKFVYQAVA